MFRSITGLIAASLLITPLSARATTGCGETFAGIFIEDTDQGRSAQDWDALASDIAAHGFTDAFGNFTYAGQGLYDSDVLDNTLYGWYGDQLALFITAMHNHGIKAHDWILAYNAGYGITSGQLSTLDANGNVAKHWNVETAQLQTTGPLGQTWLNYNSYDVRDRLVSISQEVVNTHPTIDGLLFDYIRSSGIYGTYDDRSRQEFCSDTNICISPGNWPSAVLQDWMVVSGVKGQHADAYRAWGNDNINYTMELIHSAIHSIRSSIKISAAVLPSSTEEAEDPVIGYQQDWGWWDEAGYTNFLIPMDYTTSVSAFTSMINNDYLYSYNSPVYPAINFTNTGMTVADGLSMIDATREHEEIHGWTFYRTTALSRSGIPSTFSCN